MKQTSRRDILTMLGGTLLPARSLSPRQTPGRKPNVVFILADDLGWRDLSAYGSTFYETPNIDALARRGMLFNQAYAASPICSPTRASIMTGLYPSRTGITSAACHLEEVLTNAVLDRNAGTPTQKMLAVKSATRLRLEYFTLAEAFRDAGYRTAHFGKWHLGREPYDPLHQGFELDIPHTSAAMPTGYFAPWDIWPGKGKPGEHLDDRMAEEAVQFMRGNRDRPFFVNFWCFSVHAPHDAKPDLIRKYRAKARPSSPQRNPINAAMVEAMDHAVGKVVKEINDLGLADNTIIIFFSDNGGATYFEVDGVVVTSHLPLRGGKGTLYEGGTREPCIVVWPGSAKPNTRSDEVISSIDFYPTLIEMTGIKPPAELRFDGISIVPALKGGRLKREAIYCHYPHFRPETGQLAGTYVRSGDWKLIRLYPESAGQKDHFELYNLKEDIGESSNLAATMPQKVRELNARIEAFLRETDALVPKPNPTFRPHTRVPRSTP